MIDDKLPAYDKSYFKQIQKLDNPERKTILKWDLDYLKSRKKNISTILDVGCGLGEFLGFCDSLNMQTYGLEHSKFAISHAKKNTKAKITIKDASNGKWPYENNFFDAVCAFDLLEHVKNSSQVLSEAYRVLKNGGILLATTPNGGVLSSKLLPYDPTHINIQKEACWQEEFKKAGFVDFKSLGCAAFGLPPSPALRLKLKRLGFPTKVGPLIFPLKKICATLYLMGWKNN